MLSDSVKERFRLLGNIIHIPGLMAVVSLPVCFIFDEYYAILPLLITALVSIGLGQLSTRLFKGRKAESDIGHIMSATSISWIIVPIIGTLPFILTAANVEITSEIKSLNELGTFHNSLFESMSGFTSTGLTMSSNPSELPHTIQWWRTFTEWVGGCGIILFILMVFGYAGDKFKWYYAEARKTKIKASIQETAKIIWRIYLIYTIASILLFIVTGMPTWEAVNHGMSGIATGGFTITSDSFISYPSHVKIVSMFIIITGAVSFAVHHHIINKKEFSHLLKDAQAKALWVLIPVGFFLLLLFNYIAEDSILIVDSLFQWVSGFGTCGFNSVELENWHPASKILLVMGMVIGGAAGSTTGGIKLIRFITIVKGFKQNMYWITSKPEEYEEADTGKDKERLVNRQLIAALILVSVWLTLILLCTLYLIAAHPSYELSNVLFEVASALSNVGLSTGITTAGLDNFSKIIFSILMWLGRLEIIPGILLFTSFVTTINSKLNR